MNALITILDNITETSMPFNEFVLYRANHYADEKQILIVCDIKKELPKVTIPSNLEIIYVGRNLLNIRKTIKSVIKRCRTESIPYSFHLHQVQSAFLSEIAMMGTGFRKKVLFTVHSTFTGYRFHNKVLSFFNALLAYRTTCVSKTSYLYYPKIIKKIKKDRIAPIQNGVDIERIDSIIGGKKKKQNKETIDFVYVARIIPIKNHEFLINVLSTVDKKIRFIFVGKEDQNGKLRKLAESKNVLDRIMFTGLIPRNQVFEKLINADAYISSSVLEGLPISVLEAMYCSLPCFLSDIPQHIETGDGAGDSAKILPLSVELWAKELTEFANKREIERNELGNKARKFVETNFSLRHMHEQYNTIYSLLR